MDAAQFDRMRAHSAGSVSTCRDLQRTAIDLVAFHAFEQRLEIALSETVIALALDEFEEHRADLRFGKDLQQQTGLADGAISFGGSVHQDAAHLERFDVFAVAGKTFVEHLVIGLRAGRS